MLIAKTYDLNGNMLPKKNTSIEKYQILYLSLFHIHISNVPLVHKKFHVHYQMLFQMFYLFLFHLYISKSPCALSNVLPLPVPRFQSEIGTGLLRQPPEMLGGNELIYYLILKIKKTEVRAGGGVKKSVGKLNESTHANLVTSDRIIFLISKDKKFKSNFMIFKKKVFLQFL